MNIAAILAGGTGTRMGSDLPKQFLEIAGKPIIVYTVEKFQQCDEIDVICIVCIAEQCIYMKSLVEKYGLSKVKMILPGGENRRESSFTAVDAVRNAYGDDSIILIHDAARPNVSRRIIEDNIREAVLYGACNTVIPSQDTILISDDGKTVLSYTDRSKMYLVQTPQSFIVGNIYDAHLYGKNTEAVTDDCSLVFLSGGTIGLVQGEKSNLKITTPEDLDWVKVD